LGRDRAARILGNVKSPKGKLGTARLAAKGGGASLVLPDGKPPAEFCIFRAGVNESDYGPITFDDIAAAMVMQNAAEKGNPFYFDFNHGMAVPGATDEQAKAAGTFQLEVRDGCLMAVRCQYTENGATRLAAREYNLFSPYFRTATEADGTCRPYELLNVAFVNLAGLNDLAPIAAGARLHDQGDPQMDYEALYKKAQARVEELEGEIKTLRPAGTEVVALGRLLAIAPTAGETERAACVTGLMALRADIVKVTGQESAAAALGIIEGWKEKAGQADELIAAKAKAEGDAIVLELKTVLDDGVKAGKVSPADRDLFEDAALAKGAGKPSKEGIAYLRARIDSRGKQVSTEETGQKKPEAPVITGTTKIVAVQMGVKVEDFELYQTDRKAWEEKVKNQANQGRPAAATR
jgi:hypothetical protein